MKEEQSPEITIELDDKTASGVYSNLVVVNHSESEFVLDFVSLLPGLPKARVQSRVILSPLHAKRLLNALGENIQKFESYQETDDSELIKTVTRFGGAEA